MGISYIPEKNKTISFPDDMDQFDIGHNVRVNEFQQDSAESVAEYAFEAAQQPKGIFGKLSKSLGVIFNHPDKDVIGARAVIQLNELDRVRNSDLPDEEKQKEYSVIYNDYNSYLESKGIYTRPTQDKQLYDYMFNMAMTGAGIEGISAFGVKTMVKGLAKFILSNELIQRVGTPTVKYYQDLEQGKVKSAGEFLVKEYEPLSIKELLGITGEEPLKGLAVDLGQMGLVSVSLVAPELVNRAKIRYALEEVKPQVMVALKKLGVEVAEKDLTPKYISQLSEANPQLKTAIDTIAQETPFYKALGKRGSLSKEQPQGDKIPLSDVEKQKTFKKEVSDSIKETIESADKKEPIFNPSKVKKPKPPIGEEAIKPIVKKKKGFGWKPRGFVENVKEKLPEIKVAGQYVPRSTDRLAVKAKNLIKDNIEVAEKMVATKTDDQAVAVGAELLKYYCKKAESSSDPAVKDALYDKAAELGNDMAKRLTELGRSIQAASILARMTPEGQLRFAAKSIQKFNIAVEKDSGLFGLKKKIPELTKEQASEIINAAKEIDIMPDGEAKAIKFRDLQNYISDLVPTPLFQKIVTIWKAGLLTGIKTSGLNILSNFSHAFGSEVVKDIPAVGLDILVSKFTGKRTKTFSLKGLGKGTVEGVRRGFQYIKTGYDIRDVAGKLEYTRVNMGKSRFAKGLQRYEELVFKTLGAEDQPFYYGAKARSLSDQAMAKTINSGLKGKEADAMLNKLLENPTDDMVAYAIADAETAVFQNATQLGRAASQLKKVPLLEFIIPFTKTPSAVAMQIINYTPIGFVKTVMENIGKGKFNQRNFVQGMGRTITGLPVLWLGYHLWNKDMINLDRPTTESEKKLWELENRKPDSVRIGGKDRSITIFGPAGNLLLIGAYFARALKEKGSPTEAFIDTLGGGAKSFSQQTFLTGISSAAEALTDPQRSAYSFTKRTLASSIPTIIADVAMATDEYQRRADTIPQAIMARIPGLRESLEPQIDVLGREKTRKENFFEILADPTRPYTRINEPIAKEVRRLIDEKQPVKLTQAGDIKGFKSLNSKQNTELWQRSGQIAYEKLSALMSLESYSEAPDEIKTREINKIIRKSQLIARTETVIELTKGLEDEDLKNKLSKLKEEGILNKEVFELYKKFR